MVRGQPKVSLIHKQIKRRGIKDHNCDNASEFQSRLPEVTPSKTRELAHNNIHQALPNDVMVIFMTLIRKKDFQELHFPVLKTSEINGFHCGRILMISIYRTKTNSF